MLIILALFHLLLKIATAGLRNSIFLQLLDILRGSGISFCLENVALFVFKFD